MQAADTHCHVRAHTLARQSPVAGTKRVMLIVPLRNVVLINFLNRLLLAIALPPSQIR